MYVYAVLGGGGFIGQHVVKMLAERERSVLEIRVLDVKWASRVASSTVNVTYTYCDITNVRMLTQCLEGVDAVLHCAGIVDVFGHVPPSELYRINVAGTENLIAACTIAGVRALVLTSSMEVVGPNANFDPFIGNEDTPYPCIPSCAYAESKALAEQLVLRANGCVVEGGEPLRTCALRPTGVYGENDTMLPRLLHRYRSMGSAIPRTISRDVQHSRVYVGNVAWMHVLAARELLACNARVCGSAYFCYDGTPSYNYEELNVKLMARAGISFRGNTIPQPVLTALAHVNSAVQTVSATLTHRRIGFTLTPHTLKTANTTFVVVTSKAKNDMGYKPVVSWEEACERTSLWLASGKVSKS